MQHCIWQKSQPTIRLCSDFSSDSFNLPHRQITKLFLNTRSASSRIMRLDFLGETIRLRRVSIATFPSSSVSIRKVVNGGETYLAISMSLMLIMETSSGTVSLFSLNACRTPTASGSDATRNACGKSSLIFRQFHDRPDNRCRPKNYPR